MLEVAISNFSKVPIWHYPGWGYVSMDDVVGRAEFIFWSWDEHFQPRLERIGTSLRKVILKDEKDS